MRTSSSRFHRPLPSTEPAIVYTDEAGSGLLQACEMRFPPPDYVVSCDARRTVWVKRVDGTCSFGLAQWLLRTHSISEVLEGAEAKLGNRGVKHR